MTTGDSGRRVSGYGHNKGESCRQGVVKWAEVRGIGLGYAEAGRVPSRLPSMLTEVPSFLSVSPFNTLTPPLDSAVTLSTRRGDLTYRKTPRQGCSQVLAIQHHCVGP